MSITERAKDMGVEKLVKENRKLKDRIDELEKCNLNLQERLDNKEKVNKSLREENEKLKKYYDRDKEELMESCYSLARENDELKKEIKELESDLEHRDSFFSIMRDVLANEEIDNSELASILYCVVHYECGDEEMSKKEVEIAEKFWFRDYV